MPTYQTKIYLYIYCFFFPQIIKVYRILLYEKDMIFEHEHYFFHDFLRDKSFYFKSYPQNAYLQNGFPHPHSRGLLQVS